METSAGGLDVFSDVPGAAPYGELKGRALVVEMRELVIRFVGRDDLIRMKLATGDPYDEDDVRALNALPGRERGRR